MIVGILFTDRGHCTSEFVTPLLFFCIVYVGEEDEREFWFARGYPKRLEFDGHRFELSHAVLDRFPEVEVVLVHFDEEV